MRCGFSFLWYKRLSQNVLQNKWSDGKTDGFYTGECLLSSGKHGDGYSVKSVEVTFTAVCVGGSGFSSRRLTVQANLTTACNIFS